MTWKCPKCQSLSLVVEVKTMALLYQFKGHFDTEDMDYHSKWDSTSHMRCDDCGFAGEAREFEENDDEIQNPRF